MGDGDPVLAVRDLTVGLHTAQGEVRATEGVSFDLAAGSTLGLVGESGSGKSIAMRALLGLLPRGATVSGSVRYAGRELLGASERQLAAVRGKEIAMVFQDPMSALNPIRRVGSQIGEGPRVQLGWSRSRARAHTLDLLRQVEIAEPERVARAYPHQLSGGMRQRAMIAMALSCDPKVLLCDEPTTALDVTTQDQILKLLRAASERSGAAMVFVSHDLAVVRQLCRSVLVMYAARLVEQGPIDEVFSDPRHAYTQALLRSLPSVEGERTRPVSIRGELPDRFAMPSGCRFRPRCGLAEDRCASLSHALVPVGADRSSACVHAEASLPQPWAAATAESGADR